MILDVTVLPAQVVTAGHPLLHKPCRPYTAQEWSGSDIQRMAKILVSTMKASQGVGVAANQIGVDLQLIVLGDRAEVPLGVNADLFVEQARVSFEDYALLNPQLRPDEESGWSAWFEGCLSVPGYTAIVPRWNRVTVEGIDMTGSSIKIEANGWHARVLQHEIDHLRGVLYLERMVQRTFISRDSYLERWRGLPIHSVAVELNAVVTRPGPA